MTIPRSDRVSIENRVGKVFYWKTSTSCVNLNPLSVETVDPNRIRPKIASEITSQNPSLSIVPSLISKLIRYIQRLFSVDELILLLEGNTARNPEFYYDRTESGRQG